jgi:hypothetical protein
MIYTNKEIYVRKSAKTILFSGDKNQKIIITLIIYDLAHVLYFFFRKRVNLVDIVQNNNVNG